MLWHLPVKLKYRRLVDRTRRMSDQEPSSKRNKKSDKGKKNFELNGGFSKKHVRLIEALAFAKSTMAKMPKKN